MKFALEFVLADHGMDVPEGMNVNVVENTDTTVNVTLPAAPEGHGELSDDELANAAGGLHQKTWVADPWNEICTGVRAC